MAKVATRLVLFFSLLLVLAACSGKVSYRFMDWIVAWSVDDYVTWNSRQEEQFESRLQAQLQWHKRSQLLLYRDWLVELESMRKQPLTEQQLARWAGQLSLFWRNIMLHSHDDTVYLLSQLSDRQVAQMIENFNEEQQEYRKTYQQRSEFERSKKRREQIQKFSRRWIGKLNAQQQNALSHWNTQHIDTSEPWLESRRQWIDYFEQSLQHRSTDEFKGDIQRLFVDPQVLWSDSYHELVDENTQNSMALILALHQALTDKQKKKLTKEIQRWVEVLEELAAEE